MITRGDVRKATMKKYNVIKNVPCVVVEDFNKFKETDYRWALPRDSSLNSEVDWLAFDECWIWMPDAAGLGKSKEVKPHEIWLCDLSYIGLTLEYKDLFYAHPREKVEEGID